MSARRAGYWTAVAVSVGALVAGVAVAVRADGGPSGPSDAVQAYFDALSRADAPTALALGDTPAGSHGFLTTKVLRLQQHLAPLGDIRIDDVEGTSDTRTVHYSYALRFPDGAKSVTGAVEVAQRDGDWRLVSTAVSVDLDVTAASSRATLAGAAVPDEAISLFPGAVPIRFDTPKLRVGDGSVTFGGEQDVRLDVVVSDAGRSAVGAAVTDRIRSCYPSGGESAPSCPLPDDPRIVPGSLRGTIDTSDLERLHYIVSSLASGPIRVEGTLAFRGSYARLDDNDIARQRSGSLTLQVHATTPSVGDVRLQMLGSAT